MPKASERAGDVHSVLRDLLSVVVPVDQNAAIAPSSPALRNGKNHVPSAREIVALRSPFGTRHGQVTDDQMRIESGKLCDGGFGLIRCRTSREWKNDDPSISDDDRPWLLVHLDEIRRFGNGFERLQRRRTAIVFDDVVVARDPNRRDIFFRQMQRNRDGQADRTKRSRRVGIAQIPGEYKNARISVDLRSNRRIRNDEQGISDLVETIQSIRRCVGMNVAGNEESHGSEDAFRGTMRSWNAGIDTAIRRIRRVRV